jgi:linoleate 10R-lipoxygenase
MSFNKSTSTSNGNHAAVEYPHGPVAKLKKPKPAKHGGLMQLYRASCRPLPHQTGNGTYPAVKTRPTLMQDLSAITLSGKLFTPLPWD